MENQARGSRGEGSSATASATGEQAALGRSASLLGLIYAHARVCGRANYWLADWLAGCVSSAFSFAETRVGVRLLQRVCAPRSRTRIRSAYTTHVAQHESRAPSQERQGNCSAFADVSVIAAVANSRRDILARKKKNINVELQKR